MGESLPGRSDGDSDRFLERVDSLTVNEGKADEQILPKEQSVIVRYMVGEGGLDHVVTSIDGRILVYLPRDRVDIAELDHLEERGWRVAYEFEPSGEVLERLADVMVQDIMVPTDEPGSH